VGQAKPAIFIHPTGLAETAEDEAAVRKANKQIMTVAELVSKDPPTLSA
jgi:hypothetical protein